MLSRSLGAIPLRFIRGVAQIFGFFHPTKEPKIIMNMSSPIDRLTRANAEPTRLLVIGTRANVQETIDQLCALNFCDHAEWSRLQAYRDRPGDYFSVMTKWLHRSD